MARKVLFYTGLCFFAISLFSSCITNKQKRYLQEESHSAYELKEYEEYQLRLNDEVSYYLITTNPESQMLYNSGASANSGSGRNLISYRIHEDGTVYLPFIGQVEIVGLTVREAQELLTTKFKDIVPDAQIRLTLINNYFYVLGDGGKGQYYVYKENLNIFQALAMAGDISTMGNKKQVKVVRKGDDGMDIIKTFDLRKESIVESEFYYVRPNDVIYITTSANSFFRVDSFSSFVSMFITPLSLLLVVLTAFD